MQNFPFPPPKATQIGEMLVLFEGIHPISQQSHIVYLLLSLTVQSAVDF